MNSFKPDGASVGVKDGLADGKRLGAELGVPVGCSDGGRETANALGASEGAELGP